MPIQLNWGSIADWAQAISSTVVLIFIYLQIRQVNSQIKQNDDHERFRRSWEFVRFCRDELRDAERSADHLLDRYDEVKLQRGSAEFDELVMYIFKPRVHVFTLLNQLVQHQEVDERVLYGYLEDDFNQFVEIGILSMGQAEFTRQMSPKIGILLTLWGTGTKLGSLLFGAAGATSSSTS